MMHTPGGCLSFPIHTHKAAIGTVSICLLRGCGQLANKAMSHILHSIQTAISEELARGKEMRSTCVGVGPPCLRILQPHGFPMSTDSPRVPARAMHSHSGKPKTWCLHRMFIVHLCFFPVQMLFTNQGSLLPQPCCLATQVTSCSYQVSKGTELKSVSQGQLPM